MLLLFVLAVGLRAVLGLDGLYNDHYHLISGGYQILAGDLPIRDFTNFPYDFLAFASAAAQWLFGHNLLGDVLLSVLQAALAVVLAAALAYRLTGSLAPTWLAGAMLILVAPRLYVGFKPLLVAASLLVVFLLIERRSRVRAFAAGLVVGLSFTVRLDMGLVAGVAVLSATLGLLAWQRFAEVALKGFLALGGFFVAAAPMLVYVETHSDLESYLVRGGYHSDSPLLAELASTSAVNSDRSLRSAFWFLPLQGPAFDSAPAAPGITVRYPPDTGEGARAAVEQAYRLAAGEPQPDGVTWRYRLLDTSRENVGALIEDPRVEDTGGIDRDRLALPPPDDVSLSRALFGRELKVAYASSLAYDLVIALHWGLVLSIPALVAWRRTARRPSTAAGAWAQAAPPLEMPVFAATLAATSFASLFYVVMAEWDHRTADGYATAVLAAALLLHLLLRSGRAGAAAASSGAGRWVWLSASRVLAVLLAVVLLAFSWFFGEANGRLSQAIGRIVQPQRAAEALGRLPASLLARPYTLFTDEESRGFRALIRYLHECTAADDRVFVTMFEPRVVFLGERLGGGGRVFTVPSWGPGGHVDDERTIRLLRRQSVPIVFGPRGSFDDRGFAGGWPTVSEFIVSHYRDVVPKGEARYRIDPDEWTVRVAEDAADAPLHPLYGLPCPALRVTE